MYPSLSNTTAPEVPGKEKELILYDSAVIEVMMPSETLKKTPTGCPQ